MFPNCEKKYVANNTSSDKDLSEVAFLFVTAMADILQAGVHSKSTS